MVVILTQNPPEGNVWYLAYGSNLSSKKFVQDRGIQPLDWMVVTVPGYTLAMNSSGIPYNEPSFASIRPISLSSDRKEREVIGTAYLLTPRQYVALIASEGGSIAYREETVEAVQVVSPPQSTCRIQVRTLVTVLPRRPEPRPSERYMNLITTGAAEAHMPTEYQQYLQHWPPYTLPKHGYRLIGAKLFLAIWIPIMTVMERITKATVARERNGDAPAWVIYLVRFVVLTMWAWHDYIHAPVWGRGDGLDRN